MAVAVSDGVRIHYEDTGRGTAVVWIPGTGLRGTTWQVQIDHFHSRFRSLTIDLRGSGHSGGDETTFGIDDLAADVASVMDAAGVKRACVVGLSLGSAVAQELALARPDLVERLVLLATWSSTSQEHHIRRHFESRLYALEHGPMDVYRQFAFWMSSPRLYDHEPDLQAQVEARLKEDSSGTPAGIIGHFRANLRHETRDRLPRIEVPCLVLHGSDDLITLPWYNQAVADLIPGATLEVIKDAGHLAWLERPQEVSEHLDAFLSG